VNVYGPPPLKFLEWISFAKSTFRPPRRSWWHSLLCPAGLLPGTRGHFSHFALDSGPLFLPFAKACSQHRASLLPLDHVTARILPAGRDIPFLKPAPLRRARNGCSVVLVATTSSSLGKALQCFGPGISSPESFTGEQSSFWDTRGW